MDTLMISGICRCCASEGTSKDLISKYSWMGDEEIYSEMLHDCFDISLYMDEASNNGGICEVCITQLRNAYQFKKQVLLTEEKFKSSISSGGSVNGDTKVQSKGAARDTSAAAQRNEAKSKPTNQKRSRDAIKENIEIDSSLNYSLRTRATTQKFNNVKPDYPSKHRDNKSNNVRIAYSEEEEIDVVTVLHVVSGRRRGHRSLGSPRSLRSPRSPTDTDSDGDALDKYRAVLNDKERMRRKKLTKLFDELKNRIPATRDRKRAPKVVILREAASLCRRLREEELDLGRRKKDLLNTRKKLRSQLASL